MVLRTPADNFRQRIKMAVIDFQKETGICVDRVRIIWEPVKNVKVIKRVNISIEKERD